MATSNALLPVDELAGVEVNETPALQPPAATVLEEGEAVDDEVDDMADVEGAVASSVQIAPTGDTNPLASDNEAMLIIQLGDRVIIDSKKYGRTIGTVYYRSLELISVKPDGVSNTLHDFEVEEGEEVENFKEEEGVSSSYVVEKRKFESFVEQQDFRINQIIDTFTSTGELYKSYKVVKVDKENDFIQLQDLDDEDTTYDLNFNFIGIEPDEDFKVISIRQLVGPEEGVSNEALPTEKAEGEGEEGEEEEGEEEGEEDEVKIVGFIEVVRPKVFKEAAAYEQIIPDNLQKVDALNDFISSLDPIIQKDPKSIRAVRILVETLFNLKQATVAYNDDGSIRGTKSVSAATLAELIKKSPIPMGRPVLNINKKEYVYMDDADFDMEDIDIDGLYFEDFRNELTQMIENKSSIVASTMAGAPGGQIVREWADKHAFLKKYASPWRANGTEQPLWIAMSDSDVFRANAPEFAELNGKTVFLESIPGYIPSGEKNTPPVIDQVAIAMERALSTTYRKGVDRRKQVLLPEESATMNSYLLFPIKTAAAIGKTRSSNLAIDSERSQMPKMTMRNILAKTGAPVEVGTSNDLIILDVDGGTLGNIPLSDYIEGLSIPALGLGDTYAVLEQYGMDNLELTEPIIKVLLSKIELYQSQLLSSIARLREIVEKEGQKEPEQNPFLEDPHILETITSQPTLVDDVQEYQRINPSLEQSDIGKVAYLLKTHPDYFQIAAGGNPVLIAKELLSSNNELYLQSLKIANLLKLNQLNAGEKPKKNTCKHVADYVSINKIADDSEKFQKLVEFFKKYQGTRENNWINCNVCKEHLMCLHERLQIQAFLNPKEKQTIEKEVILKFSGGAFQGKYICRNCGQAIRDLDFDNGIEFDDNGKPKSGRAVLVDEDALFQERVDMLVSVPIEPSQKQELKLSDNEVIIYDVAKELSARLGINLDNTGFRNIIDRTIARVGRFPTIDGYAEFLKKNPKQPEYDVAKGRYIISNVGIFLLLEIQTKIPSYSVKYALTGCASPGFDGYPLQEDASNKQGLEYMACAIASVSRNETPWKDTKFQTVKDDALRRKGVLFYLENTLKEVIGDDTLQAKLVEKRKYLEDLREKGPQINRPRDEIPATFLPEQIIITPEAAAKEAITPEVVANMGNRGKLALVKLWIRQAHLLAKKTASLVRGSPLSETTCCLTSIQAPGTFWKSASDLPQLGKRRLMPYQQGQMLMTEFMPREAGGDVAEPDSELYYRIFLKCCFQGPRFGYPHEPGLTNQCPWCGFQFPTIPTVMDTDTEGKSALASQNVNTDTAEFTRLLDTIHNVNEVKPVPIPEQTPVREIMAEFGTINPAPIDNWAEVINETTNGFLSLPPDADRGDIALAAGPISEATSSYEQLIQQKVKDQTYMAAIEEIIRLPWINFFQVIQNYFITPFSRLLNGFSPKGSLFIPIELKQVLSEDHVLKDLVPILENDLQLIAQKGVEIISPKLELARSKIKFFIEQLSKLIEFKNKIRPIIIPGRDMTLTYIQRAMFYGPLSTLMNSASIPAGTTISSSIKSMGDPSMRLILELIAMTIQKYKRERLTFNDQEIKELIAIRNEKERVNVIAEFNKLTDEERAVELINKKLGIGKWSVGGTKLIYAYDKDYHDLERRKREAAGIIDFPGLGPDQMETFEGRQVDENGLPVFSDEELEQEGGYDMEGLNIHADEAE
jgi:hypothetical protein